MDCRTVPGSLLRSFEWQLRAQNRSERTVGNHRESARLAQAFLEGRGKRLEEATGPTWRTSWATSCTAAAATRPPPLVPARTPGPRPSTACWVLGDVHPDPGRRRSRGRRRVQGAAAAALYPALVAVELTLLSRVAYRDQEVTGPRLRGLLALLASDLRTGCSTARLVEGCGRTSSPRTRPRRSRFWSLAPEGSWAPTSSPPPRPATGLPWARTRSTPPRCY
jgi:hypothetical protein